MKSGFGIEGGGPNKRPPWPLHHVLDEMPTTLSIDYYYFFHSGLLAQGLRKKTNLNIIFGTCILHYFMLRALKISYTASERTKKKKDKHEFPNCGQDSSGGFLESGLPEAGDKLLDLSTQRRLSGARRARMFHGNPTQQSSS